MRTLSYLAVCAVLLAASASHAQVIQACAHKQTGVLRLVSDPADCGQNESAVSWKGPEGSGVTVKDVNDVLVGAVLEGSLLSAEFSDLGATAVVVVRRFDDRVVGLTVAESGFAVVAPNNVGQIYFESNDCTGTPLIPLGNTAAPFLPIAVGNVATGRGYYQTGPRGVRTRRSRRLLFVQETQCISEGSVYSPPDDCCQQGLDPLAFSVSEAVQVDLDALGLVPPFRIEVE